MRALRDATDDRRPRRVTSVDRHSVTCSSTNSQSIDVFDRQYLVTLIYKVIYDLGLIKRCLGFKIDYI